MAQYIMLLHQGDFDFSGHSPEDMQAVVAKYGKWAQELGQAGKLIGGEKLADNAGKVLRPNGGDVSVTDGPFSETKEMIGGYFVIEAESLNEAVEISKSCPHIDYDGPIELREIDKH